MTLEIAELKDRYYEARLPSPDTRRHYDYLVDRFARQTGIATVPDVTRPVVVGWRNWLLDTEGGPGLSPRSWNNYRGHFRTLWRFGMHDAELLPEGPIPWEQVAAAPVYKRRPKTVPMAVLTHAITVLRSSHSPIKPGWFWEIALKGLYYTGMRRRQLAGLQWRDIDIPGRRVVLRAETSKTKEEWEVPLVDELIDPIEELLERTVSLFGTPAAEDQVFNVTRFHAQYKSRTMSARQLSRAFQRLSAYIGHPLSPHMLRHTLATEVLRRSGDIKAVQEILGHTSISTTMIYLHPDLEAKRGALETVPVLI